MAPRKGPGENYHKGSAILYGISDHKPQVAKNGIYVLETKHLRKSKRMPVFIISKGLFAILFGVYPLFSTYSLFKTAKNVE